MSSPFFKTLTNTIGEGFFVQESESLKPFSGESKKRILGEMYIFEKW